MPKITGIVHVRHPETQDVITLSPGDDLPDWAVDIVTNPDVLADDEESETPIGDALEQNAGAGDPPPVPPVPPAPASPRDALLARAKELKIKVDPETTDTELQLLIASKE